MREVVIDVPQVKWEDIGGQHDTKQKLKYITMLFLTSSLPDHIVLLSYAYPYAYEPLCYSQTYVCMSKSAFSGQANLNCTVCVMYVWH